jgi:hypothetical protein
MANYGILVAFLAVLSGSILSFTTKMIFFISPKLSFQEVSYFRFSSSVVMAYIVLRLSKID